MPLLVTATGIRRPRRGAHAGRCGWFWAWVVVGAVGAFGLISFGLPFVSGPALLVGALMALSPAARRSSFGLLTGTGVPLLLVAYAQRDGPGTTCYHTATSAGCDQHLNPVPWLLLGLALVIVGVIAQIRRNA